MLIQSLSSTITDSETKQSILELLNALMLDSNNDFTDHFPQLIPLVLELTHKDSKIKTRMTALDCIQTLSKFPFPKIFPFKTLVISELGFALDDSKRVVRKHAVVARNLWMVEKA
jgi:hypothetical protein